MKQIADLLVVNINYNKSLSLWDWYFEAINLDLCKPTEMCVQICKNARFARIFFCGASMYVQF